MLRVQEIRAIQRKQGTVYLWAGHQYHFKRIYKNESILLRCAKYKSDKCNGSLTISKNYEVLKENEHKCIANFTANDIAIKMDTCKKLVTSTNIPVPAIYNNALLEIEASGINIAEVPLFKSIKSRLYNARKEVKNRDNSND